MAVRDWFHQLWPMGGVLSASLFIAWATEVTTFFLSRGLAFALLALLQVLPEFAIEAVITYQAAVDESGLRLVTANFTGANRLIVGLFVPLVYFMAAHRARRQGTPIREIQLGRESSIEVMALLLATAYSFTIVMRAEVNLVDAAILVLIYVTYLVITFRLPPSTEGHEDLPLVPRMIRMQPLLRQKLIIIGLFLVGGALLFSSIEPFYHNTIQLGVALGIGAYFLFQWIAPLLSEFPELITIVYWGRTGRANLGLTNAISSKVNQWTLLIAMVPIVYAYGTWRYGRFSFSLHFDSSQQLEILLTAAQGLFAAACFVNLRFQRREAWTLLLLWAVQLLDPLIDPLLPTTLPFLFEPVNGEPPHYVREWTTLAYLVLTPFVFWSPRGRFAAFYGFRSLMQEHLGRAGRAARTRARQA